METFQEFCYPVSEFLYHLSNSQRRYDLFSFIIQTVLHVYLCVLFVYIVIYVCKSKRVESVKKVVEILLCNLTLFLLSPVILAILTLVLIIRLGISGALLISSGGRISLLKNTDAFWSCDAVGNTNYLYIFGVVDDIKYSKELFTRKVSRMLDTSTMMGSDSFAKLKYKIIKRWGFFCWDSTPSFDVKTHVQYLDENDPLRVVNKSKVVEQLEKFFDTPLPDGTPKWKFYFIPKFKEDNSNKICGGFVWRIHHCYMDGLTVSNCCNWLFFDYPRETAIDYFKPWDIKWYQRVVMYLYLVVLGPYNLIKSLAIKENHCFHGPLATNSKTLGISRTFSMKTLKAIKNATNSSIPAVLITAIGGGLRSLALKKGYEVPPVIASSVSAAMVPYERLEAVNRFTVAHMPIEIGHDDIRDRLKSAIQSAKNLKGNIQFLMNYQLVKFVGLFPAAIIEMLINNTHTTLVLSNVPGYKESVQVDGCEIKELITWNVIKGYIGLGVCSYSYADRINTGFIGDSSIFHQPEDLHELIRQYENEMVELAKYAGVSTADLFLD